MYTNLATVVLASESPRRKQYLAEMGVEFIVRKAVIDEIPYEHETSDQFVERMACEKAELVSANYRDAWVIGGDTIVCLGTEIFGKPVDKEGAVAMLLELSGREHEVKTGFCITNVVQGVQVAETVTTKVRFAPFSESLARAYVATGESLDKAGAYGIQGKGAFLVQGLNGSYSNVVGLPVHELLQVMLNLNIIEISSSPFS